MLNNLNILLPEIFLTLSIFSVWMIGVFIKESFSLIFNLSSVIILFTIAIILNSSNETEKIFLDSFTRDSFSNFFKILILIASLFVLNTSKVFIIDNKDLFKQINFISNIKNFVFISSDITSIFLLPSIIILFTIICITWSLKLFS